MRETSSLATKECVILAKMIESVASRAATPFKNAPYTDFTRPENRQAQMEALEKVKRELGQTYPLIIGGEKITNEATFASRNPSQPNKVPASFSSATVAPVDTAVQSAATA